VDEFEEMKAVWLT